MTHQINMLQSHLRPYRARTTSALLLMPPLVVMPALSCTPTKIGARHSLGDATANWTPVDSNQAGTSRLHCPAGSVLLPSGQFEMGHASQYESHEDHPPHTVASSAFCLDRTEVTTAAYRSCVDAGMCSHPDRYQPIYGRESTACNWGRPQADMHPINCLDWTQARAFCAWSGGRLPTEAEWEYAARGSTGRIFPWGFIEPNEQLSNLCGMECSLKLSSVGLWELPVGQWFDPWEFTSVVGSFPAGNTPEGIQDLAGNVWEWVEDAYASDAYSRRPRDFSAQQVGVSDGTYRVVRGHGWSVNCLACARSYMRAYKSPSHRDMAGGFRCAREPQSE